jgi:tetratricopeptide (TPR) repeat protein
MIAPQELQRRAVAALRAGALPEAERCYRALLAVYPHPGVLHNLGLVLVRQRRDAEAVPLFERSLAARFDPNVALALSNALLHCNRPLDALACCDEALAVEPAYRDARLNKAVALRELNRHEDAAFVLHALLAEEPSDADAEFNLALAELMLERYASAWHHYEARWRGSDARAPLPDSPVPVWRPGESLADRAVLVQAEQGFGDTLQFLSLIPTLEARCARVDVQLQPELVVLFRRQWPARLVDALGAPPAADVATRIGLLSLPLALAIDRLDPIAAYVRADPERVGLWRGKLRPCARRIGIAWRGNPVKRHDPHRSIPVEALRPWLEALAIKSVAVVALQRDASAAEREWLSGFAHVEVLGETLRDFDDTAAVMTLCDGIVSVDTSLIHLAGALGRPAVALLKFSSDWRWGIDRRDGSTYQSVRTLRQGVIGDWSQVVRALVETSV